MVPYGKLRKPLFISISILASIFVILKLSTSKHSGKNFQEVLQNIPNENILGLSNLIYSENEKNKDDLLQKLSKLNSEFLNKQDQRLSRLEKINEELLEEIRTLRSPPDISNIREKLIFLYPYRSGMKFPAYIWQTWKYGLNDDRFEERFKDGESQWAWKNPGFVHEMFNDDTSHAIVRHFYQRVPEVVEAYESLPEVILRMDFFRYLLLFAKGGVYADIDTYPLQPVPNWIPENVSPDEIGLIIGVELDLNTPDWRSEAHRRLQFGQFVIQAKPGHPVLREVIARIVEETLKRKQSVEQKQLTLTGSSNQRSLQVTKWTGSGIWTDVLMNYFNDYLQSSVFQIITWKDFHELTIPKLVSDILILPISSFSSEEEIPKDGKIEDNLAFVKHFASKIWKST